MPAMVCFTLSTAGYLLSIGNFYQRNRHRPTRSFKSPTHEKLFNMIVAANERIKSHVHRTPVERNYSNANLSFKCECDQLTGSFKLRGAFAKLTNLTKKSITTASTGNHALATTHALNVLKGIGMEFNAQIFVPQNCNQVKLKKLKALNSPIKQFGFDAVEAEREARRVAKERGITYVSPYNDFDIMSGQGTVGVEIIEQCPKVEAVFVPVGGGGLIVGIAAYIKAVRPSCKIVGCSPTNSACLDLSVKAGRILREDEFPNQDTLSDGTAGGIDDDSCTYDFCSGEGSLVDEWVDVSEEEIKTGLRLVMDDHKKIVEGAAGVSVGSYLKVKERYAELNCVVVLCGRNISTSTFCDIVKL